MHAQRGTPFLGVYFQHEGYPLWGEPTEGGLDDFVQPCRPEHAPQQVPALVGEGEPDLWQEAEVVRNAVAT